MGRSGTLPIVQVLLATDAEWLVDDVVSALGDADTSFVVCSEGREVSKQVTRRTKDGGAFDIAVVDLQIGSMGGIAVTMALRLDATAGNAPDIPILVLLDRVADGLLGEGAGNIMGVVSLVSLAASISAMTFVGPRVYFAMARDGVFIPAAAQVHPRFATPARSIVAQSIWSTALVMTGSLDALGNYVGFAMTLFAGIAVGAVFVLRRRDPSAPRPFKAIGYPLTPAIFVIASLAIVVNAIVTNPRVTGLGLLVILAGIPIYWWFSSRRRN